MLARLLGCLVSGMVSAISSVRVTESLIDKQALEFDNPVIKIIRKINMFGY